MIEYAVRKHRNGFWVIVKDDEEVVGWYPSRVEAKSAKRALVASEKVGVLKDTTMFSAKTKMAR